MSWIWHVQIFEWWKWGYTVAKSHTQWLNRLGLLAKPALPDGGVGSPPAKAGGATDSLATTKTVVDEGHNES